MKKYGSIGFGLIGFHSQERIFMVACPIKKITKHDHLLQHMFLVVCLKAATKRNTQRDQHQIQQQLGWVRPLF